MKQYVLLFLSIFIFSISIDAQTKPNLSKRDFDFGKYLYCDYIYDSLYSIDISKNEEKKGIVFKDSVFHIYEGELSPDKIMLLLRTNNLKALNLLECSGLHIELKNATINQEISLENSQYLNFIMTDSNVVFTKGFFLDNKSDGITNLRFINNVLFKEKFAIYIHNSIEENEKTSESKIVPYSSRIYIDHATFDNVFSISGSRYSNKCVINSTILINNTTFNKEARFNYLSFSKAPSITQVNFKKSVSFANSEFNATPEFISDTIGGNLDLSNCRFNAGLDLRTCKLVNDTIFFTGTEYPDGKLFVEWKQLKGSDKPRIQLKPLISKKWSNEVKYCKLEDIYKKLRDNYLAQGKTREADEVMYELEHWKYLLADNPLTKFRSILYDTFLGYGYKPWRFIIWLVLPLILLFSIIWYYYFFGCVIYVMETDARTQITSPDGKGLIYPVRRTRIIPSHIYDHRNISQKSTFLKVWYILYFSGSVLLSLKFKKDWICELPPQTVHKKSFMAWVVTEWVMGILLYVIFGAFVLNSQFGFIKGLLGI